MSNVKTRAGIAPATIKNPEFDITTEMVRNFLLDRRFSPVVAKMRQEGKQQSDVHMEVLSIRFSNRFAPFLLLMDDSVAAGKKGNKVDAGLKMFNIGEDKTPALKSEFFQLLKGYMYNKNDESTFFSNGWRNSVGIGIKSSRTLKEFRLPKVRTYKEQNTRHFVCFIDPLRVFYDMLANPDMKGKEKYIIGVPSIDAIDDKNFTYHVIKKFGKNSDVGNVDDIIIKELHNKLK